MKKTMPVRKVPQAKSDPRSSVGVIKSYVDNEDTELSRLSDSWTRTMTRTCLVEIAGTRYLLKVHNGVESRLLETYRLLVKKYYSRHMTSSDHLQTAMMQLLNRENSNVGAHSSHTQETQTRLLNPEEGSNASFCA
jgi:hypothetical protein